MEQLNFQQFIQKAAADTIFLNVYVTDPERLRERFDITDADIARIAMLRIHLEPLSATFPEETSIIRDHLAAADENPAFGDEFNDNFNDRGFSDRFNDRGGDDPFRDVFRDRSGE